LPQDEGWVEKAQEYLTDYLNKIAQIASFEPTILPLMFFLGVVCGAMITLFSASAANPANKKSGGESPKKAKKKAADSASTASEETAEKSAGEKKDD
jgi:hypothetical protein